MNQSETEIEKYCSIKQIVDQLESCNYESVGGPLVNNIAFIALKRIAYPINAPKLSTGITDRHGKEIFENDPLFLRYESITMKGTAKFINSEWLLYKDEGNFVGILDNQAHIYIDN
jgi:hypothetical protein